MSHDIGGLPLLFLCRHGQTEWNADARIQGQQDIELNDLGRVQAARNGSRLRDLLGPADGFDFVCSPMKRTLATMRIVRAEMGLSDDGFRTDARLMELNFGDWEGFKLSDIAARDPAAPKARSRDKWNYRPSGETSESYAQLAARALPVFEALDGPTVMVAHGGITRVFLGTFAGVEPQKATRARIPQDRILKVERGQFAWI